MSTNVFVDQSLSVPPKHKQSVLPQLSRVVSCIVKIVNWLNRNLLRRILHVWPFQPLFCPIRQWTSFAVRKRVEFFRLPANHYSVALPIPLLTGRNARSHYHQSRDFPVDSTCRFVCNQPMDTRRTTHRRNWFHQTRKGSQNKHDC